MSNENIILQYAVSLVWAEGLLCWTDLRNGLQNFTATIPSEKCFDALSQLRPCMLTLPPCADAIHYSGRQQPFTGTELNNNDWYYTNFLPTMENYKKGPLVWTPNKIRTEAEQESRLNAIVGNQIYDLSDYFYTIDLLNDDQYKFLDEDLAALWQSQPGADITQDIKDLGMDPDNLTRNMNCIHELFYIGETDFRKTPRCQVQPNMLLAFSILLMVTILAKFLAALQFGSKRMPEQRDKFVICQSPLLACFPSPRLIYSLYEQVKCLATLKAKIRYARRLIRSLRSITMTGANYSWSFVTE